MLAQPSSLFCNFLRMQLLMKLLKAGWLMLYLHNFDKLKFPRMISSSLISSLLLVSIRIS